VSQLQVTFIFTGRQPSVYLLTDTEGRICGWGGDIDFLQPKAFKKGDFISDIFDFMHGILPIETEMLLLPDLSIQSKRVFDAHVFQAIGGYGLILVGKGAENRSRVSLQQFTNTIELEKITHFAKIVSDSKTGISETPLPYLSILADAIFEHNGYIETLIGDRLVALFGMSHYRRQLKLRVNWSAMLS